MDNLNDKPMAGNNFIPIIMTGTLTMVFILIAGQMIFQDYLEALRMDRSFYFSESFFFKIIWFVFIPICRYFKEY